MTERKMYHLLLWILLYVHHTWSQQVNVGYSKWSSWSQCNVTCGNGTQQRNRSCTKPPLANGGASCLGPVIETRICTSKICPTSVTDIGSCRNIGTDKECAAWKSFCNGNSFLQHHCAKTCGACQGSPVNGGYSQWAYWTRCSRSCAGGSQQRFRTCNNPTPANGGTDCRGLGPATESRKCFIRKCPVKGGYSQWSVWSPCSMSCDGGTKRRFRSCTNPPPAHGGRDCRRLGRATESRSCNIHKCPVDGGYSPWSSWDVCSKSCDGGTQTSSRTCTNPPPAYGGRDCWKLGPATQIRRCKTQKCPVHGGYSQWSDWSPCTRSCDGGTDRRYRSCTSPPPAYGGKNCSGLGQASESRKCNTSKCPVCKNSLDDNYCIKWSEFCSSNPTFPQDCKKACGLC